MAEWKTDGWKYTDEQSGIHETRHEAVGAAAIEARKQHECRSQIQPDRVPETPPVKEAAGRVYAFKPFICGFCHQTFLTEEEYDEHRTCPHYEPTEGRQGSNPLAN